MSGPFTARPANLADAPAMTVIYNQGIEDRIATFETTPRGVEAVEAWLASGLPVVVVTDSAGAVVGYAATFAYSDRCCYAGIAEFSVYVERGHRGAGVGKHAMAALIDAARAQGMHKLLSRVFVENSASLGLLRSQGFREVGVHQRHGQLDGVWRDVVAVERLIEA
jgi:phosphinothricin acetyltransferase